MDVTERIVVDIAERSLGKMKQRPKDFFHGGQRPCNTHFKPIDMLLEAVPAFLLFISFLDDDRSYSFFSGMG